MRFFDGVLTNFASVMGEVFYDWDFTPSPILHKLSDRYSINKTEIFKEGSDYYLVYKMTTFKLEEEAFKDFETFYDKVYNQDLEVEKILSAMSWSFDPALCNRSLTGMVFNTVQVLKDKDKYFYIKKGENGKIEISKESYKKLELFLSLLKK